MGLKTKSPGTSFSAGASICYIMMMARLSWQSLTTNTIGTWKQGGCSSMSKAAWRTKIAISIARKYTSKYSGLPKYFPVRPVWPGTFHLEFIII
jgi:hypothetical protein